MLANIIILLLFQAGLPWFSILTRTGVFRGKENDNEFPADKVCQGRNKDYGGLFFAISFDIGPLRLYELLLKKIASSIKILNTKMYNYILKYYSLCLYICS